MGEVIKYCVMWDNAFFDFLDANASRIINLEPGLIENVIYKACSIKAQVVSRDERESGLRSVLYLGHTFGHAVEVAGGFGGVKHGEAVAIGMCMAARLSEKLGLLSWQDRSRIVELVDKYGLPNSIPPRVKPTYLLDIMTRDKKNRTGLISLSSLQALVKFRSLSLNPLPYYPFFPKVVVEIFGYMGENELSRNNSR